MSFTLATWNINSVRLRVDLVARLLQEETPDVLCLQECKSPVEKIPAEVFAEIGYPYMVARGQKGASTTIPSNAYLLTPCVCVVVHSP